MVELVDTRDLGSLAEMCAGSSPVIRTTSRTTEKYVGGVAMISYETWQGNCAVSNVNYAELLHLTIEEFFNDGRIKSVDDVYHNIRTQFDLERSAGLYSYIVQYIGKLKDNGVLINVKHGSYMKKE